MKTAWRFYDKQPTFRSYCSRLLPERPSDGSDQDWMPRVLLLCPLGDLKKYNDPVLLDTSNGVARPISRAAALHLILTDVLDTDKRFAKDLH